MPYYPPAGGLPSGGSVGDVIHNTAPATGAWTPEFRSGLGKYDPTGYQTFPTLMNPSSSVFSDGGWWQVYYTAVTTTATFGFGAHVAHVDLSAQDGGTTLLSTAELHADSDGMTTRAAIQMQAAINHDGSGLNNSIDIFASGQNGELFYNLTATQSQLYVSAQTGQTAELFTVYTSAFAPIFQVKPTTVALFGGTGSGQFAAIADADIGTVVAKLNTLLADLRLRGDLAT